MTFSDKYSNSQQLPAKEVLPSTRSVDLPASLFEQSGNMLSVAPVSTFHAGRASTIHPYGVLSPSYFALVAGT